jgi:dihydrofolate reductase
MGRVISSASMSLDGYVAHSDDTPGSLFDWYNNGEVEVRTARDDLTFQLTPQSADYWQGWTASLGALIVGRRLFDVTDGWGGVHPLDVPVVVVTHDPPTDWHYPGSENFSFITAGIEAAVARAQEIAGDRVVGVAAGTIAGQCLAAGLLDEVAIDLVPVVLGSGRRYFGDFTDSGPPKLGNPTTNIQGERVTHLVFPVDRG